MRALLDAVAGGQLQVDAALSQLDDAPVDDLGFASVDQHRALRQGFPEVVFGQGKSPDQVEAICARLGLTYHRMPTDSPLELALPEIVRVRMQMRGNSRTRIARRGR